MNKIGVITERDNDSAIVMVGHSSTCGNCGCGALTRKNGKLCDNNHQFIKVKNSINANIGDPVSIEFKSGNMIKTSIMLYLIPLIMFVFGIFAGNQIQSDNKNDIISFLTGIVFLVLSFFILSRIDKKNPKEDLITISEYKGY